MSIEKILQDSIKVHKDVDLYQRLLLELAKANPHLVKQVWNKIALHEEATQVSPNQAILINMQSRNF